MAASCKSSSRKIKLANDPKKMFGLGMRGLHKRIIHELFYVIRTHEETKDQMFCVTVFRFRATGRQSRMRRTAMTPAVTTTAGKMT